MRNITLSFIVSLALLMLPTVTQAKTWTSADVILSGSVDAGDVFLQLSHISNEPTYTNRNFRLSPSLQNKGLAIALAAMSSKKQIVIYSDIDEVDNNTHPTIQAIYMSKKSTD